MSQGSLCLCSPLLTSFGVLPTPTALQHLYVRLFNPQVVLMADGQITAGSKVVTSLLALPAPCAYTMHGTPFHPQVVLMADGQITAGSKVVKPNARKLRRLATEPVPSLGGFAGAWAEKTQCVW
jgi:ATP-dependent protease HslVU (ClpYQ) peptidase subunit